MPDHDEIDRLRAADPVAQGSVPPPDSPDARALLRRITMQTIDDDQATALPDRSPATPQRRVRLALVAGVGAATVVVAAVAFAVGVQVGRSPTGEGSAATDVVASDVAPPITSAGGGMASCVEVYEPATLARREYAFDGTVVRVEGDAVTFSVLEWFRGGPQSDAGGERYREEISLEGASAISGLTSAGAGPGLDPGTRLLVAGDGGFVWGCGFTQPYDPTVAQEWRDALASS